MVVYLMAFKGGSDGLWWWCRKTSRQLGDAKAKIELRQQWQLVVGIVAMGGAVWQCQQWTATRQWQKRMASTMQQSTNNGSSQQRWAGAGDESIWGQRLMIGGKSSPWQEHWQLHNSVQWQKAGCGGRQQRNNQLTAGVQ
jgi:hypothetical protein